VIANESASWLNENQHSPG